MRKLLLLSAVVMLPAGCWFKRTVPVTPSNPPAASLPSRATRPTTAPADRPAAGKVMATVNGVPVYLDELNDLLIRSYGLSTARQLIANELVRQEAQKQNITVTDEDVQAAKDQALENIFGTVESPEQRKKLLEQFLDRYKVSRKQWGLTMRRNALLGKLAGPRVTVTDAELREAFGAKYGRQVVVRHIQIASLADAQEILKKLAEGADFVELAKEKSTNAATAGNGGLLEPIGGKESKIPPAMKQAALALKTPGELTEPIQVGTAFHILKLERIIEPQDAKFEDVKDKLTAELRDRKLRTMQQRVFQELFRAAEIEYVEANLKAQAEKSQGPKQ